MVTAVGAEFWNTRPVQLCHCKHVKVKPMSVPKDKLFAYFCGGCECLIERCASFYMESVLRRSRQKSFHAQIANPRSLELNYKSFLHLLILCSFRWCSYAVGWQNEIFGHSNLSKQRMSFHSSRRYSTKFPCFTSYLQFTVLQSDMYHLAPCVFLVLIFCENLLLLKDNKWYILYDKVKINGCGELTYF